MIAGPVNRNEGMDEYGRLRPGDRKLRHAGPGGATYKSNATGRVLRRWRAGVRGRNQSTDRYRCGGTGLPQASGLFVSLPFRRAIARLVPIRKVNIPLSSSQSFVPTKAFFLPKIIYENPLLRLNIGQLGTDSLRPAFHTRWA